jgi:hypothetical protein
VLPGKSGLCETRPASHACQTNRAPHRGHIQPAREAETVERSHVRASPGRTTREEICRGLLPTSLESFTTFGTRFCWSNCKAQLLPPI